MLWLEKSASVAQLAGGLLLKRLKPDWQTINLDTNNLARLLLSFGLISGYGIGRGLLDGLLSIFCVDVRRP
jgi:hypothetical protein